MTHPDLHIAPTGSAPQAYPPLQSEDYLPVLRGLSVIAWVMLAGMISLEVWIRSSATLTWPHLGGFGLGYHMILGEFGLATLMFSLLITHRAWFERAPREASAKLHQVLWVMLSWLGLHFFGLLHLTGGLNSPLMVLLPVAVLAAYLTLPAQPAGIMAGGLIGGLVLLQLLEASGILNPGGALSHAFQPAGGKPVPASALILLAALLVAIVLGRAARTQFQTHNLALHRQPLCDPLTRLYTRETLQRRLATELVRAQHQNDPTAILLLEIRNLHEFAAEHGFEAGARLVQQLAAVLANSVRDHMDTPARFDTNALAALLPTLGEDRAQTVIERVAHAATQIPVGTGQTRLELAAGLAVTRTPAQTTPDALLDAAAKALAQHAAHPDQPVPVALV